MKIMLASANIHKKGELERLFPDDVFVLPESFDCDENGTTFIENSLIKARTLHAMYPDCAVMADDSGLMVDALPSELGIHTARYGSEAAGRMLSAEERNRLLLKNMEGIPWEKRTARFVSALVFLQGDYRCFIVEETVSGHIIDRELGANGFGYDPVFFVDGKGCTMAELSEDEKNKISHRGRAAARMSLLLDSIRGEKKMSEQIKLRKDVDVQDTWDLTSLYKDEAEFEADIARLGQLAEEAPAYQGMLSRDPDSMLKVVKWYFDGLLIEDMVGNYAFLNWATDGGDSTNQRRMGITTQVSTRFESAVSFIRPEFLACENAEKWIDEDPRFDDYRIALKKQLRFKAHTLTPDQEKILAMQQNVAQTPSDVYGDLCNVDMQFDDVEGKPLTQSTFSSFLINPDRKVRKEAYEKFYKGFESHKNTIAKLYYGSVKQDIFSAQVRNYKTALEDALYADDVDESVYLNLIKAVHDGFPLLHRFYEIKRKALGLDRLAHYDVYMPIVSNVKVVTPYDKAVGILKEALAPLGQDYVNTIIRGITTERWVDKYENKGKRSGAFSSGSFKGNPFMLLNYKDDVLRDVFTLAHEGGHSMHSYYSVRNNPFPSAGYTIFEAEVASTFNEQLIAKYLLENAESREMKAYIVCKQLDDIVATLFRQTMFAEYELKCHQMVEAGEPLTVESLRKTYRGLIEAYFGPDVELPEEADLEGIRIPHFYNAYYVYKYSTGISASIALSEKVLNGGKKELDDYLGFLKSGGSKFPIDSLRKAGVDMSTPEPVNAAVRKFGDLMDQLEKLLDL